jgi:peptidoglycan-N-acetylmuramic acid deacetylase
MFACAKNPDGIKGTQTESTGGSSNQMTSNSTDPENKPGDQTAPNASDPTGTAPETSPSQPTDPAITDPKPSDPTPTDPKPTEPDWDLPDDSHPGDSLPGVGDDPGEFGQIYTLDELKGMSTTKTGYGPGVQVDEKNRPVGATSLQKKHGKYEAYFIAPDDGNLYLTFDEGYENGYTPKILDTLKEKNVKAVFFVTMAYCKSHPELVQRMIDEGHAVGNHSVSHLSMPTLSITKMVEEVMGLHEYVKEHFGYEMHLFRPPMGEYSVQSLAVLHNLGYKTVEWSFAYYDYDTKNQMEPSKAFDKVMGAAHSGGIFLLHAVSKTNTEILGDVIDACRNQGLNLALFS